MGEAQEIQMLNQSATNLANTLGYTPEAVQAREVREASSMQVEEFKKAEYTRHLQNKHSENTAKRNVKKDETRKWLEEYQKENPVDEGDPDDWAKNAQMALREDNPKLWNPSVMTEVAAEVVINSDTLMKANYSIGVERGKQVAETLSGVVQNVNTTLTDPKATPEGIDTKLAGYSVQMTDRLKAIHPGFEIQITQSENIGPGGERLLNISYTDPDVVNPTMTSEEMEKTANIEKKNMTPQELQSWGTNFLTKQGPSFASVYTKANQARNMANLEARNNATMIYDTKTDSFMQVWQVTNKDNQKQWFMGKGGDLSKAVPFPNMQTLMDTGRVQVISGNGEKLAKNMLTDWSEDPANEGMPVSREEASRIARAVRGHESGVLGVGGEGSKDTGKVVADAQKVIANTLTSESSPETRKILQGAAGMYGAQLADLGYSPDQIASLVLKSEKDYGNLSELDQGNRTMEDFVNSYVALAVSGGGKPGSFNYNDDKDGVPEGSTKKKTLEPRPIRNLYTVEGKLLNLKDRVGDTTGSFIQNYKDNLKRTRGRTKQTKGQLF